ncbi:hypothetical protein EYR36_000168 [Pleurotus pulmonarius]|nr:hypothetical protein EYR36_000164 [Pleurotus pulmonarius]KAF4578361.1 hypothetical protein EYR36_000168 [Pleurotus pulmonarius]
MERLHHSDEHKVQPIVEDAADAAPVKHHVNGSQLASLSTGRKRLLLAIFCFAQFLDTFNNSALFASIPPISQALGISNANSVWLLSAYQLTFAALLLTSGRLSDVYNANYVFIAGAASMGFLALGAGFVREEVPLIVLRALMGIGKSIHSQYPRPLLTAGYAGAALTVPSALQLIIVTFPDPVEQSQAVALFAGTAGIGNILGLFIGAILVTFTSWPWVFYFIAITAVGTAVLAFVAVPAVEHSHVSSTEKIKRLDIIGISTLTIALVLFVFAVTSGSISGWGSAKVIANLVISIVLVIAFFVWEARIDENRAALSPKIWKYTNFSTMVACATLPFLWWGTVMLLFSWLWQEVYGWSALITAVHFLPISLMGIPFIILSDVLQKKYRLKYVIMFGMVLTIAGSALLPFADSREKYWRFAFPGLLLGTSGVTVVFTTSNIAVFKVTPPQIAGTVGAVYNCFLELSCAAGVAIITSIQTSVEVHHGGPTGYSGRAAGFWFLFAFVCVLALCTLIFTKNTIPPVKKNLEEELKEKMAAFETSRDVEDGSSA